MSERYKVVEIFNESTFPNSKPNWDKILDIIDHVKKYPVVVPILVECMLDKLYNKNPNIVWLTLIVIDSCMKNCFNLFIDKIDNKYFMRKMKWIIYKRYCHPKTGEKLSSHYKNLCGLRAAQMIQTWGLSFHTKPYISRYPIFFNTYQHLIKDKGIIFPETGKNEIPIITESNKKVENVKKYIPLESEDISNEESESINMGSLIRIE